MPTKKHPETPEEQAKTFRREAKKLIAAGELSPDEGHRALDLLVAQLRSKKRGSVAESS